MMHVTFLNSQCKRALKSVLQVCTHLPALEPLLYAAPNNILKHVLCQFSKVRLFQFFLVLLLPGSKMLCVCVSADAEVLPHDSKSRRLFVTSGGLRRVQELKADPGSVLQEYINNINACFSEEMVRWDSFFYYYCIVF